MALMAAFVGAVLVAPVAGASTTDLPNDSAASSSGRRILVLGDSYSAGTGAGLLGRARLLPEPQRLGAENQTAPP